ncbi:MAG: hypothetical protein ACWA5P_01785 [bacterium]
MKIKAKIKNSSPLSFDYGKSQIIEVGFDSSEVAFFSIENEEVDRIQFEGLHYDLIEVVLVGSESIIIPLNNVKYVRTKNYADEVKGK